MEGTFITIQETQLNFNLWIYCTIYKQKKLTAYSKIGKYYLSPVHKRGPVGRRRVFLNFIQINLQEQQLTAQLHCDHS